MTAILIEIILGFLTFTGSLIAAGKLQEFKWIPQRPGSTGSELRQPVGASAVTVLLGFLLVSSPDRSWSPVLVMLIIILALNFGGMLVMPIGGADMPTVISILNAYAGLSAVAMGFVLDNKLLMMAGALDGSSGLILSIIMCQGHEPLVHERAVRRFRAGAGGGGDRRAEDGQERDRRRRRPDPGEAAWSSSFRATAWPSPRPSIACASCTTS